MALYLDPGSNPGGSTNNSRFQGSSMCEGLAKGGPTTLTVSSYQLVIENRFIPYRVRDCFRGNSVARCNNHKFYYGQIITD